MDWPLYQQIVFALLMPTNILCASDVGIPCKVVGLFDLWGHHQTEEHHKALHKQKEEIKGCFNSDLNSFTHRLDQLVEVAVLAAAAGPLEIFARSMQHTQPGDLGCAWCSAQKIFLSSSKRIQEKYRKKVREEIRENHNEIADQFNEKYDLVENGDPEVNMKEVKQKLYKEFQKRVAQEVRILVCEHCYYGWRYQPIAYDNEVQWGNGCQYECLSCLYLQAKEKIVNKVWIDVTEKSLMHLKVNSYISICEEPHDPDMNIEVAVNDPDFAGYVLGVVEKYIVHVLGYVQLFSKETINVPMNELGAEQIKKLIDLLKAYKNHLAEVSEQLSPQAELKLLKYFKNKPEGAVGFLHRKPFIERLYSSLCTSQKQVEKVLYAMQQ